MWQGVRRSFLYSRRLNRNFKRLDTTKSASINECDINNIPLDQPLPGFPAVLPSNFTYKENHTEVTVLDNGMRVASERSYGKHCTVGIVADSGSRYEVAFPSGVSHFIEKSAYGSCVNFKNRDVIMTQLEKYGGICDCQIGKDVSIYAMSAENQYISDLVGILSDVVWRPIFPDEELEVTRNKIRFELEDMGRNPMKEPQLMELVHSAAYRENTLGLPKTCPAENVDKINTSMLHQFMRIHFAPSRLVLAGVGVDHQKLVEAAQKHFARGSAIWDQASNPVSNNLCVDKSVSQYTGGKSVIEQDLSELVHGPELAHITIGLESCHHQSADFVATCVLNTLMGGGGSFSAGGPGKGMYSRLYTRVLNRQHWMYNATAFNHSYADSGVFCIYASAHPDHLRSLAETIVREMCAMACVVDREELARAKKQLTSMLLMNLETRPVQFEDIGRQVLATGKRKRPDYYIDAIDKVSLDDVRIVAQNMLASKPSLAALGKLDKLPSLEDVSLCFTGTPITYGRKLSSLFV